MATAYHVSARAACIYLTRDPPSAFAAPNRRPFRWPGYRSILSKITWFGSGTADEIFLKIDVNPKDDRLTKEEFNAAKLS